MSSGEDSIVCTPVCQGFLKKRKDRIRIRWTTYWFKLHNSTLFFYHKEHGSSSDLRGQYYLFEVESVREITWTKKKHYSFEIAMKNGKRKVLAAETDRLRQLWMCQLSQALNYCVCNTTESYSNSVPNSKGRTTSSPCCVYSNVQPAVSAMLVKSHYSAESDSYLWSPSEHFGPLIPTARSHYSISDLCHVERSQCTEDNVTQEPQPTEHEYDVLPPCKPLYTEEPIYDTPPSNWQVSEREHETTENIYDVPKYSFRKKSLNEASCAKELPEITGLLHEMMICLGGNSADLVRATAQRTLCQP